MPSISIRRIAVLGLIGHNVGSAKAFVGFRDSLLLEIGGIFRFSLSGLDDVVCHFLSVFLFTT